MTDRTCEYMSCSRVHFARGLCDMHYRRFRRKGFVERSKDFATAEGKPCGNCKIYKSKNEYYSAPERHQGMSWACKKCNDAFSTEWRNQNLERKREIERTSARKKYKENPERFLNYIHQRRSLISANSFLILEKEIKKIYTSPCAACNSMEEQTLDHIIPLSRNGTHGIGNIQTLCFSCNSSKRDKTMMEWRLAKENKQ